MINQPTADAAIQTGIAAAAGASSATIAAAGTIFGIEYVVFLLALLGGATSLIYMASMPFVKMLSSVIGSTVLGVVAAQLSTKIILATAVYLAPFLQEALADSHITGKMLIAFLVGFIAQKSVPILFDWLDSKRIKE